MSFHGGFLGAMLAIVLFARGAALNALAMLDLGRRGTPIGLFFGRIANFINGELWGRPAPDVPWRVVFPHGGPGAAPSEPALRGLRSKGMLLFVVLAIAVRRFGFRRPGLLGGIFVLGYALARIVCEFFREPDAQLGFLFALRSTRSAAASPWACCCRCRWRSSARRRSCWRCAASPARLAAARPAAA